MPKNYWYFNEKSKCSPNKTFSGKLFHPLTYNIPEHKEKKRENNFSISFPAKERTLRAAWTYLSGISGTGGRKTGGRYAFRDSYESGEAEGGGNL